MLGIARVNVRERIGQYGFLVIVIPFVFVYQLLDFFLDTQETLRVFRV
jgi:hypothetical protein